MNEEKDHTFGRTRDYQFTTIARLKGKEICMQLPLDISKKLKCSESRSLNSKTLSFFFIRFIVVR